VCVCAEGDENAKVSAESAHSLSREGSNGREEEESEHETGAFDGEGEGKKETVFL
jgi:hypothetical protein